MLFVMESRAVHVANTGVDDETSCGLPRKPDTGRDRSA